MKNIFVQKTYNKFINNIDGINIDNQYSCSAGSVDNIYKNYYRNKYNVYIFCANMINDEIVSFISDNTENVKFYFYHNEPNKYIYKLFHSHTHLVDEDKYTDFGKIIPKNIINDDLYQNLSNSVKEDIIPIFLENYSSLPSYIANQLYPNTKKRILLFNNKNIKHDQNVGFLSEEERRNILQKAKYYACDNGYYMLESKLSGCQLLDISNLDNPIEPNIDINYTTYKNFIWEILQ